MLKIVIIQKEEMMQIRIIVKDTYARHSFLQTCSDICGTPVSICGAIAALDMNLLNELL